MNPNLCASINLTLLGCVETDLPAHYDYSFRITISHVPTNPFNVCNYFTEIMLEYGVIDGSNNEYVMPVQNYLGNSPDEQSHSWDVSLITAGPVRNFRAHTKFTPWNQADYPGDGEIASNWITVDGRNY